ncbi:MAG: amidohydrolase, partial [Pseudomonas sp.]
MQRLIPNLLAAALACSSFYAMAAADLVLVNGKVYTAEPGQALMQAVAIKDGKILQVGSDA